LADPVSHLSPTDSPVDPGLLRRTVAIVAGLNLAYFFVEVGVALAIGSVSLFADSVDFLEDTAVNTLIFVALGWSLRRRALAGKAMAGILLVPAAAAAWEAISKVGHPEPPSVVSLVLTAGGAALVNGFCAWLLARVRRHGGSLSHAAYLSARNDVAINLAIIAMAVVTVATHSGWPDLVLGVVFIVVNVTAAREVWQVATEERLAAKALAGDDLD
jgi:Co/Zn/Cd efflux system component